MTTSKEDKYYWIEFVSDNIGMNFLVSNFPETILEKTLAIVSFDSDSFLPTKAEFERGWIYKKEIKPQNFILNGDKFIFGTDNQTEYEKIKASILHFI